LNTANYLQTAGGADKRCSGRCRRPQKTAFSAGPVTRLPSGISLQRTSRRKTERTAQRQSVLFRAVGLKIEINEIHQNLRNPMCIINKNPPSATKSTSVKQKLSKSNVSSHKMKSFDEIQYCL